MGFLDVLALATILAAPTGDPPASADGAVSYGRDIRPILSDRCFACHGADPSNRKAGLRLDTFEFATLERDGLAAVVPGDPEASELWRRVTSADPDERMPPAEAKRPPITAAEREALRAWIEGGAAYERHWSFVPPSRPAPPRLDAPPPGWTRSSGAGAPSGPSGTTQAALAPVDAFVLARMRAAGVEPSPRADPATLVRRVFLDVTGLPPTTDELAEHTARLAAAGDPQRAWDALIDRLLTEEPYRTRHAEHFASPWLDAARYADTIGIHTDNGRQMWPWRDWLLRALRDGMPYDAFATEQLAGDLLPDATRDQLVASGFNRSHVITDEGGAIDEEYLFEYAVDRVNTASSVFLGLTAGCARCHDHKFDPLTQADYYGLLAFFNSNEEPGLYSQTPDPLRAYEPFIEVPSAEDQALIAELEARLDSLRAELEAPLPGEAQARVEFERSLAERTALDWATLPITSARSSDPRVSFSVEADGSVQLGGPEPDFEDQWFELDLDRDDQRLLLLEALATPGAGPGAGRAEHGNSVLTAVEVEWAPSGAEPDWEPVPLVWAWADHTQKNRDYEAGHVLRTGDELGWAHDGNKLAGERDLLLLTGRPLSRGRLRVHLEFRSPFPQHSIGRLRLRSSPLAGTDALEVHAGRWYRAGPFLAAEHAAEGADPYELEHGPERATWLDRAARFGAGDAGRLGWSFEGDMRDGEVFRIASGVGITYLGRELWSPDRRTLEVSLGSDDGLMVFVNGALAFERRVDRGAAPDQDRAELTLERGPNLVVLKIVNTGGPGGAYWRQLPREGELSGELGSALLPADAVSATQAEQFHSTWRRRHFEGYRVLDDEHAAQAAALEAARSAVPKAMVMRERAEPRPTFVMQRGQYDLPDPERPVQRSTPGFLPPLSVGNAAEEASRPPDRLSLARWLTAPQNPLFSRVAVNRLWQQVFGQGLVRTPQDFGIQGEWPTHPELLDWLAVELRESGWDTDALLRTLLSSATYRQASVHRPELDQLDPEGRLLAAYPRRRLSAEQIRDHALFVSGLLVERLGGPPVKPHQPEGLWREVSMLASNTRDFVPDEGEGQRRRSLYTYWKRAVPPPSLQTFDAPTRESCVIQRQVTNTPLQALVLWNDVQYVEAARALAARALAAADEDAARLEWMLLACTARTPDEGERELWLDGLARFRAEFRRRPEDARALLAEPDMDAESEPLTAGSPTAGSEERAAWTLLANAALNLHETLTQD